MPKKPGKVVSIAKVREANELANGSMGAYLREFSGRCDRDEISNVVMAWTMADGSIHYGYTHFKQTEQEWEDCNLRLLGLCEVVKGALVDILTANTE